MIARFQPHGQFSVFVEGRIIVSDVTGPWNKELVDHCASELHLLAKALSASGPHVGLTIVRQSLLCPPDAFERLRQAVHYGVARLQCIGNAIVVAQEVEGRSLLHAKYTRMYGQAAPSQLFDQIEPARAWSRGLLKQAGY